MRVPPVPPASTENFDFAASGRRVFAIEGEALVAVAGRIDGAFTAACRAIHSRRSN